MSDDVTVVIPAHDDETRLRALLAELDSQAKSSSLAVIVVDDASARPLESILREQSFGDLRLSWVRSDRNLGPGGSRNLGLALVTTPWVAYLDSDELPGPGWLHRLNERVTESDPPDVIEGRISVGSESATPFTHIAESEGWQHVAGNVAYRTEALRGLGGFSDAFYDADRKLHFREDTELYFRLQDSGLRLEFDENLLVLHPPRPASLFVPVRDARRYFFDPLLSKRHPARFRDFVSARRAGPLPLRWARHNAALLLVLGLVTLLAGVATERTLLVIPGGLMLASGWGATVVALAWRRQVGKGQLLPLLVVSALVPWVYLWNFYRGAIRFRHLPRLR